VTTVTLAIDAMGGDYAPSEIIKGAVEGAKRYGVSLLLVGKPEAIQAELNKACGVDHIDYEIVPALETIDMGEAPLQAMRKKKDASIVVTARLVGEGRAQGMVAAGSSGAAMAAALFQIGRIEGIDRPAIAVTLPNINSPTLLIDAGANVDCEPDWLTQFAHMGHVFMQNVYGVTTPKVGLLNIGEEEKKGNAFSLEAHALLKKEPGINFIGNVEGRDLFLGDVDVAVCDGFTGNVALKSAEGIALMTNQLLKRAMKAKPHRMLGALLAKSGFAEAKQHVDPESFGGALLLGVNGVCVIAHGNSSGFAIQNAIRVAKEAVQQEVVSKIQQSQSQKIVTNKVPNPL
jgi:phosphate acyltransferase